MAIVYKVKGLAKLDIYLKSLVKPSRYLSNMNKAVAMIQADAKSNCPVDEGELRNSIGTQVTRTRNSIIGTIFAEAPHAIFVEFGTGPTGRGSYPYASNLDIRLKYSSSPWTWYSEKYSRLIHNYEGHIAQPFMYPAYYKNKDKIIKMFKPKGKRR